MVHAVLLRDPGAGGTHQNLSRKPGGAITQAGDVEMEEILHTDPVSVRIGHNPAVYVFKQYKLPGELELHLRDARKGGYLRHRCVFHANLH